MQGSYNIVSELHLQCGQLFKPAFVYLCKVFSGLCLVWMAHRRKSFSCLYKKDILKYTVLIFHALYYVFHTLHNIGSIFMFSSEQSFERCLPLDSYSHILCLSCGGQLFESDHASFMKGSKAT